MKDRFVEDRLPPPELLPEFHFDLPEVQYSERLNAAVELLRGGDPDALAIVNDHGSWTYADLDDFSGRIARLLDSTSKFGAELDSLSDFVAFGVAPSVVLYVWTMDQTGRIGWGCALLFSACMALRLARFNTKLDNADVPAWTMRFFTGVPAPAGAGLVLLPLIAYNEYGSGIADSPWLVGPWMVIVAGLLVSRIPTFSFKRLAITQRWVLPAMVVVVVFVALLVSETWNTTLGIGVLYLASIPFSHRQYQRLAVQRPNAPTIDQRAEQDLDLH